MAQTVIQKSEAIRVGSLVVEVGYTQNTLVNIGAFRDLSFDGKSESTKLIFDNVPESTKYKNGDKFSLKGNLCELNFTNLAIINGGQTVVTYTAGTPVVGATQTLASGTWASNQPVLLAGQNSSGAIQTIASVVGSVDGTLTASNYSMVKLGNGWAIAVVLGGAVTTLAQDIVVTYGYTPNAKKTTTFNATGIKKGVFMRLTNTNEAGKNLTFRLRDATNTANSTFNFAGDLEDNVLEMPVEIEGILIDVVDEQQTT
jgi:hypothetical protein